MIDIRCLAVYSYMLAQIRPLLSSNHSTSPLCSPQSPIIEIYRISVLVSYSLHSLTTARICLPKMTCRSYMVAYAARRKYASTAFQRGPSVIIHNLSFGGKKICIYFFKMCIIYFSQIGKQNYALTSTVF